MLSGKSYVATGESDSQPGPLFPHTESLWACRGRTQSDLKTSLVQLSRNEVNHLSVSSIKYSDFQFPIKNKVWNYSNRLPVRDCQTLQTVSPPIYLCCSLNCIPPQRRVEVFIPSTFIYYQYVGKGS